MLLLGTHGYAPSYNDGLMRKVAERRGLAPVSCMVSRPTGPLGGWVYVYGVNTHALRRCKIVDVSAPRDLQRHIRMRRVVEIAGELEAAFCGHRNEPVAKCPVVVLDE